MHDANRVCSAELVLFLLSYFAFRLNTTSTFDLHHTLNPNPYADIQSPPFSIFTLYTLTSSRALIDIYTNTYEYTSIARQEAAAAA